MLSIILGALLLTSPASAKPLNEALVGTYVPVKGTSCETTMGPMSSVILVLEDGNRNHLHVRGVQDGSMPWIGTFDFKKVGRTEVIRKHNTVRHIRRLLSGNTITQLERTCFLGCGPWKRTLRITLLDPSHVSLSSWGYQCDLVRRR